MKVTIIIPCYNESDFVEKILDKINSQTNISKEIIVINDGSNEKTSNILNDFLCSNKSLQVFWAFHKLMCCYKSF